MSIKIWPLIIVSVKAPPTSIYRAKQSSVFKRMPCLPGSRHMVECAIFVITGQFCAGWCYYYFTSSRSQNRIMTCYEWPRNHCAVSGFNEVLRCPWKRGVSLITPLSGINEGLRSIVNGNGVYKSMGE